MKGLLIFLAFCFILQQGSADIYAYTKTCLMDNGFKNVVPPHAADMRILEAIGDPDSVDILQSAPKDKLVDVIVCIFRKDRSKKLSLYDTLTEFIKMDDKISDSKRTELLKTLNGCHTKDGSDAKLLNCVNAIRPPFDKYIVIIRDVTNVVKECFVDNKLSLEDLRYRKMLHGSSVPEIFNDVSEDNLICALTCEFERNKVLYKELDPNETLYDRLVGFINKSGRLLKDKKKEMRETLNKCKVEAGEDSCKLAKCVKVLRPPFVTFYFRNP